MTVLNPTIIELKPDWFKMGYYVYVVLIKYNDKKYFYIGMTGDRKYKTARSPFYRMSGHFMLGKSTQNQIIKGIEKHIKGKVTDKLLCKMNFTYFTYMLHTFDAKYKSKHTKFRIHTEKVESYIISNMREEYGKEFIFNSRLSTKSFDDVKEEAKAIIIDLRNRINE